MLSRWWGYGLFLAAILLLITIRVPFMIRSGREGVRERRTPARDAALLALVGVGELVLPVAAATGLLAFADQPLRAWRGVLGVAVLIPTLLLFYRSHADLGTNWSVQMEIRPRHLLVTTGVYSRVRHPMYASLLLLAVVQLLLLPNAVAAPAGLVAFLAFLPFRLRDEERLLRETFGEAYVEYARRSGRLLPFPRRQPTRR